MIPSSQPTQRSDAELFTATRRALDLNPMVPAAVRVHVDGGIVTLTGGVRTSAERLSAESTVRPVDGVRGVVNDILVTYIPAQGFDAPDDGDDG
jgi:osmotically-inducible protein OsmY